MTHDELRSLLGARPRTPIAARRNHQRVAMLFRLLAIPEFADAAKTCARSGNFPAKPTRPSASVSRTMRELSADATVFRENAEYRERMAKEPATSTPVPSAQEARLPTPESTAAATGGLDTGPGDAAAEAPEDPSMQHPLLKVIDGGAQHEDPQAATLEAWQQALAGFERALDVTGLPPGERARLLRCHRHCAQKTRTSPLALARRQRQDRPEAM